MCKGAWAVGQQRKRPCKDLLENEAEGVGKGGEVRVDMRGGVKSG